MKKIKVAVKRIETVHIDTNITDVNLLANNKEILNKIKRIRNITQPEELLEIIEIR